jgi:F-type H+-transporting ATPase subunit a
VAEGGFAIHPMDQFVVKPLFGGEHVEWYTITNVTLWLGISVLAIIALMVIGTRGRAVIPSRSQSIAELLYGFIHNMVEEVTGHDGVKYFPYVMTLFMFVLVANLLGLIPMSFTTTSHVAVTVTLALLVFFGVLAIIEVISYFVRPVSHSIRLAGNLMAGHAVIKVFAGFASMAVISPVAIGAVSAIYALELLVAVVQAYVFTILTCVYLKDAVGDAHH